MSKGDLLEGSDISEWLRRGRGAGTGCGRAPDGVATIEFMTDPTLHGLHAQINVRGATPDDGLSASFGACARDEAPGVQRTLLARLVIRDRCTLQCASDDSIRFWGTLGPAADLIVEASTPVRLVARTPEGALLAGPVMFGDAAAVTLSWPAGDPPAA